MQTKYKKIEKQWNDVEKRIMFDAELFHFFFAQQVRNTNVNVLYIFAN